MKVLCFNDNLDESFQIGNELLKKGIICIDLYCILSEILWKKLSFVESLKILNFVAANSTVNLDDNTIKVDRIGIKELGTLVITDPEVFICCC
jgi:hypothetical protein